MMRRLKIRMKQVATVLSFLAVGIMLLVVSSVAAQKSDNSVMSSRTNQSGWRVFSPPDKSFTVELPREPRHTNKLDPTSSDENEKSFFECTKSVDAYTLPQHSSSRAQAFVIGVFDVSACQRRPEMFNEEVEGLVAVIGGDNKRLLNDAAVRVDGLPGREFVYESGDSYGRVLIVNAGKRIYMLLYKTDIPGATSSTEVTRMFRTFHPARS